MSMITELVERLRKNSALLEITFSTAENLREAADVIEELSAKLQVANMERSSQYYNGGWIPISERLPEDKQAVLVWGPQYKNIYCAYLENEQWWIFGAFAQIAPNEVIAWMPLPEPNEVIAWMPLPEPHKAESDEV